MNKNLKPIPCILGCQRKLPPGGLSASDWAVPYHVWSFPDAPSLVLFVLLLAVLILSIYIFTPCLQAQVPTVSTEHNCRPWSSCSDSQAVCYLSQTRNAQQVVNNKPTRRQLYMLALSEHPNRVHAFVCSCIKHAFRVLQNPPTSL